MGWEWETRRRGLAVARGPWGGSRKASTRPYYRSVFRCEVYRFERVPPVQLYTSDLPGSLHLLREVMRDPHRLSCEQEP